VCLETEFAAERRGILGEGRVRWCATGEQRMGVEITSLEATCRDWVYHMTAANPLLSFIPGVTVACGGHDRIGHADAVALAARDSGTIGAG
jgi:hypothetical protein